MELFIAEPEGASRTIALEKNDVTLGRSVDNDLAYPDDPWLSRYHLRFEQKNRNWYVKDCASRNGTMVNATTLKESHLLQGGDRIYAGHLTIEIRDAKSDSSRRLVSFVTQKEKPGIHEATVVTNLDKVLSQTADQGRQVLESTLGSRRVVRALIRAGQELAGHRPLDDVFRVILDLALNAVQASRGVILTLEENELVLRASEGEDFSISTAVRDRVVKEKCSLMISDAQLDDAFRSQRSIVAQRVRSIMAVPLQTGQRVIGLLYVDNGALIRPFSQEDLEMLTVMANVAAIRIEHARLALVEQSEKLMESEFAQASEIQRSLLPFEVPPCQGCELAGLNIPCHSVGGDYYDFLPQSDGRLGLLVGDVSGKGLPAALMMSSLQARVHMLTESAPDPATALTILNRKLAARCPLGKFITLFYALLDPVTGRLEYSNAGHNFPLVIRANGKIEQLRGSGMVLGIQATSEYQISENALGSEDMLVLFSDGVTEARRPNDHEDFGDDRLAAFLKDNRQKSAEKLIHALASHVRTWSGQTSFSDDFTIVIARKR